MVYDEFNQTAVQPKIGITFAVGAAPHPAPGSRRHHGGRDPRPARPRSTPSRPRSPATWSSPPCTPTTPRRSITRLVDLGVERFLISSTLVGTMAQRLVRRSARTAPSSATSTPTRSQTLRLVGARRASGCKVKEGAGCLECRSTGYFGRTGIFEILPIDDAIKHADQPRRRRPADQARGGQERHAHAAPVGAPRKLAEGSDDLRGSGAGDRAALISALRSEGTKRPLGAVGGQ